MDALLAELLSGDEARAEAAALQVASRGASAIPSLKALLTSDNADHRWWAVRALAEMTHPPLALLLRALEDACGEIRQAAALALCMHPSEEAVPALAQALNDADGLVGTLASYALRAIGPSVVPDLLEAFEAAAPRARLYILRALAGVDDPRAAPLMLRAMDGDSALLRYWASAGLERLGWNMVYVNPIGL